MMEDPEISDISECYCTEIYYYWLFLGNNGETFTIIGYFFIMDRDLLLLDIANNSESLSK